MTGIASRHCGLVETAVDDHGRRAALGDGAHSGAGVTIAGRGLGSGRRDGGA
ncbi:MAG TPA: hypothetical protein VIK25_15160 [Gemmatimonadaceae bacterium]